MRITDAKWDVPVVSLYAVECDCGRCFSQPSTVIYLECPVCHKMSALHDLTTEFLDRERLRYGQR